MPEIALAFIIGCIEGITEFLPVSSTGHLLLFQNITRTQQSELFNVVIQVAAVMAVIPLFRNRIKDMLTWHNAESKDLFIKTAVAFLITAEVGLLAKKLGLELPETALPVAIALFVGGLLFVVLEKKMPVRSAVSITWTIVAVAALGQIIAMVFPGASRSGSTIILMLLMGLNREKATEFSFLIGIPTMLAAGGYEILDAVKDGTFAGENISFLLISCLFSAITAFVSVKWLLGYVKRNSFAGFGLYRMGLSVLLVVLIAIGVMR